MLQELVLGITNSQVAYRVETGRLLDAEFLLPHNTEFGLYSCFVQIVITMAFTCLMLLPFHLFTTEASVRLITGLTIPLCATFTHSPPPILSIWIRPESIWTLKIQELTHID